MHIFILFQLFTCFCLTSADHFDDIFVSVDSMRQAVQLERYIVSQFEKLRANLSLAEKQIDKYLEEFQKLPIHVDAQELAKDPLFTFQIMRRLGLDLIPILKETLVIKLPETESRLHLPTPNDAETAAAHLVQLQGLYNLSVDDIINGRIKHYPEYTKLNAEDVIILAKSAKRSIFKVDEAEWTKVAYELAKRDLNTEDMAWKFLKADYLHDLLNLDKAIKRKEEVATTTVPPPIATTTKDEVLNSTVEDENKVANNETNDENKLANNKTNDENKVATNETNVENDKKKDEEKKAYANYIRLCKGESHRTPEAEAKLYCAYTNRRQPYLLLRPIKMELLSNKPKIQLFYDLLTPKEIEKIQAVARRKLRRSTVSKQNVFTYSRSSKTAWMTDKDDPIFAKMTQIVRLLTGMVVIENVTAELHQVVNYGLGGQYYSHYDDLTANMNESEVIFNNPKNHGGRLSTFMYYLSDVEEGGYTVFPKADVFSKPYQGSAIFWYNLFPSGITDMLTFHGGCPVLYGSKWISNKWIHYKGQMSARRCGLKKSEWEYY